MTATTDEPAKPLPPAERLPRGRRYAVRTLLVLATVVTVLSIVAVWADRQLLNAEQLGDRAQRCWRTRPSRPPSPAT